MGSQAGTFWGFVAAALILALAYIGYREYEHHRDMEDLKTFVRETDEQTKEDVKALWSNAAVSAPSYHSVDPRIATEAAQAKRPRRLADNQRCVGGLVIAVDGSSYTQTGERCSGRFVVP